MVIKGSLGHFRSYSRQMQEIALAVVITRAKILRAPTMYTFPYKL